MGDEAKVKGKTMGAERGWRERSAGQGEQAHRFPSSGVVGGG